MLRYLLSRTFQAVLVLWGAFTLTFFLLQIMPGDAVLVKFLSPDFGLSREQIEALREAYGLGQPVAVQYIKALSNVLYGDFGYSVQAGVPVSQQILTNLPSTLRLASLGFIGAAALAFILAFLSALAPFRFIRKLLEAAPGLFLSIPLFWIGIILVQVFSFQLGLISIISPGPVEAMVLPVITLAIPISAPIAQVLIQAMDEAQAQPYTAVLRAKGASTLRILWRHTLRNAALPTLTVAGLLFGELLGGAVVTETVFGLNGIGKIAEQAVRTQDSAVLQAIVLVSAALFVFINLLIDLVFPLVDPRLKTKGRPQ